MNTLNPLSPPIASESSEDSERSMDVVIRSSSAKLRAGSVMRILLTQPVDKHTNRTMLSLSIGR